MHAPSLSLFLPSSIFGLGVEDAMKGNLTYVHHRGSRILRSEIMISLVEFSHSIPSILWYRDKNGKMICTRVFCVLGGRAETPTLEEAPMMPDANSKQLDEIKALTMHHMVDMDPSGRRRLIFLTNHQAKLFDASNIPKVLQSLEYPTPKLVIWFMPCCGGTATITNGMITQFKQLKASDPEYEQTWKKLLKVQAVNSPDPVQKLFMDNKAQYLAIGKFYK